MNSKMYSSAFSVLSQAFPVASNMNSDRTSNNCFWTMGVDDAASNDARTSLNWTSEEDKAFEIALFTHYNHADMWGKIALAVPGKTVQDLKLHYEALSLMAFESGKMPLSIYSRKGDVLEEKKLKSEQVTRESSTARTGELFPGNLERAAAHAGTQLLSGCAKVASGDAFGKRGRPKKAVCTNENKLVLGARYPRKKKAVACNEGKLLPGKLLRSGYPQEAPKDIGYQLLSGYPNQLGFPSGSLPTPSYGTVGNSTGAAMRDIDELADGRYDIGSSTDILDDLDISLFPYFWD
ncbi:uncharacterized protein LOC121804629 isoform X1 [Salvia splendens]|uniref:uncharacterized protein LOC121804629 isoform X1 n=2 Tax=Salvia splendens TaxID=180675 RepID=UPI001C25A48A|nr:uncharacterized protein LOC121804629 isoform X1 [Salvia splendens]XP_042060179.1 uncharacterized protein LOC121804629 isoform X1 [Salvia splendens]